ncbi:MAG TPA: 30S ribosome-binding factor RbfA [Verrucomicrobiales bacterium]|nr:30S ribosome-binding factor RbfA [Verrucomicrobiales bacterium]
MPNLRQFRVRELLKREIGEILRREIPVETAGLVSVHDVILSNDLKSATVFVGILGSTEQKKHTEKLLHQLQPRIRGQLSKGVVLKYTPRLRFKVDDSVAEGDRVLRILDEIEKDLPQE